MGFNSAFKGLNKSYQTNVNPIWYFPSSSSEKTVMICIIFYLLDFLILI